MKAELFRGKLMAVDDDTLTFIATDGAEELFPYEGLDIDEAWIKTYLGSLLECTVIDGVIKVVSPA